MKHPGFAVVGIGINIGKIDFPHELDGVAASLEVDMEKQEKIKTLLARVTAAGEESAKIRADQKEKQAQKEKRMEAFSRLASPCVHGSVLYVCFSIAVLKINSSVPSF